MAAGSRALACSRLSNWRSMASSLSDMAGSGGQGAVRKVQGCRTASQCAGSVRLGRQPAMIDAAVEFELGDGLGGRVEYPVFLGRRQVLDILQREAAGVGPAVVAGPVRTEGRRGGKEGCRTVRSR